MTGFILGACLGFMLAQFIGLVTTTTPDRAARNLRDWRRVVWWRAR